jgi:hypothetical protein
MTALLAGYFVLRFTVLDVGAPELVERSSGFGFRVLDTDELVARFGASPWIFYAYNVVTSGLSVLFGEPRAGVFRVLRGISAGAPSAAQLMTVAASTLGTVVIGAFIWQRRQAWLRRAFERDDQIVALFVIVLAANAVISYPYTKDVIMSPAGLFYAAALFAAARHVLFRWMDAERPAARAGAAAFCLLLATSWAVREVGMHVGLRVTSFKTRNDWGYAEDRFAREGRVFAGEDLQLFQQLRRDALFVYRAPPPLWLAEIGLFDVD